MLLLRKFKVSGHSMEPVIKNQQRVLVSKIPYLFSKPKAKEIVAFNYQGKILIKRIAEISSDKYSVKGDNSKDSLDSRSFGSISESDILGKVIYIF